VKAAVSASLAAEGQREFQGRSALPQTGAESADEIVGDVSRVRALNGCGNLECPGLGQDAGCIYAAQSAARFRMSSREIRSISAARPREISAATPPA
jgi:hypothetical protein